MKKVLFATSLLGYLTALWCLGCEDVDYQEPNSIAEEGADLTTDMADDSQDVERTPRFATHRSLSNSLLVQIDKAVDLQKTNSISYPFCIYTKNIPQNSQTESNVQSWAQTAIKTWIAPLGGQSGWRATQVTVKRVQRTSSGCPSTYNGLSVYSIEINDNTGASNAGLRMYLGGRGIAQLGVLHEMGHGMGLGDLYDSDTRHAVGQPKATMNSNNRDLNGVLTTDDIDGIRFVWARLRGNTSQCPSGYVVGGCSGSDCTRSYFCIKGSSVTTPTVTMSKTTYAVNESIVVKYSGAAGNSTDWIGLFASGAANTSHLVYKYTGGNVGGTMTFTGRSAGAYEARLFFNDGYTLKAKVYFTVK